MEYEAFLASDYSPLVDSAVSLVLVAIALLVLHAVRLDRRLKRIIAIALIVRFITAILIHFLVPYGLLAEDNWAYAWFGKKLADSWQGDAIYPEALVGRDKVLFYYELHGAVYLLIGYTPLVMSTMCCIGGCLAVFFSYRIAEKLADQAAAYRAAWLVALFPSLVLWSSMNLRDIWVILSNLLLTLSLLEFYDKRFARSLLDGVAGLLGVHLFRFYLLPLLSISMILGMLLLASKKRAYRQLLLYCMPVIAIVAAIYFLPRLQSQAMLVDLSARRKGLAEGGSAYYGDVQFTSLFDIVAFAPIGLAYFLWSPFPWSIAGGRQLVSLPETCIWYYIFARAVYGAIALLKKKRQVLFMIGMQMSILIVPFALVSSNMGTGYRHRAQVLPYFMILAAEGWVSARKRRVDATEPQSQAPVSGEAPGLRPEGTSPPPSPSRSAGE